MLALRSSGGNPRSTVEASIHELTCRLRARGLCRVSMTMVAAAAMTNARRIWHFEQSQLITLAKTTETQPETDVFASFLSLFGHQVAHWLHSALGSRLYLNTYGLPTLTHAI